MPKYQALPRAVVFVQDDYFSAGFPAADQVIESDHAPVKTGLLDATGTPLYRMPENIPLGFDLARARG